MANKSVLVVTHIIYRETPPLNPLEGPYSSTCNALAKSGYNVDTIQIPLEGFNKPIIYGKWTCLPAGRKTEDRRYKMPAFFGYITPVKYFLDTILIFFYALFFWLKRRSDMKLVIGIDPLSVFPLILLKKMFGFTLIFYSVDFNRHRFKNGLLQLIYEKMDEVASRYSDQVWVVCQSLKDYKKKYYGVDSIYIPNSSVFDESLYKKGKGFKTGSKLAWTGSFLTNQQFDIFFGLLKQIQNIRPEIEFYFAPTGKSEQFRNYAKKYKLKRVTVLELKSRRELQEYASTWDVGIAIYDPDFGSTEFIEPLKIWDFMLCGMPSIISCEPSLSDAIKQSGVAYILGSRNTISDKHSLQIFLDKDNLAKLQVKCVELAEKYDIERQINIALRNL